MRWCVKDPSKGRYQRYVPIFKEDVLRVDKYFNIIQKDVLNFVNSHKESDFISDRDLVEKLKIYLDTYKIILETYEEIDDGYITFAGTDKVSNIILIINYHKVYKGIRNIFSNEFALKEFLNDFRILCKHELIHRFQLYQRKIKSSKTSLTKNNFDSEFAYYSNPMEIMTYAFHFIEHLRIEGRHDNEILAFLRDNKESILQRISPTYKVYFELFNNEKNKNIFNKFKKYIYMYLKEPHNKEYLG